MLGPNVTDNLKELTTANKAKPADKQRSRKEIITVAYAGARLQGAKPIPRSPMPNPENYS